MVMDETAKAAADIDMVKVKKTCMNRKTVQRSNAFDHHKKKLCEQSLNVRVRTLMCRYSEQESAIRVAEYLQIEDDSGEVDEEADQKGRDGRLGPV